MWGTKAPRPHRVWWTPVSPLPRLHPSVGVWTTEGERRKRRQIYSKGARTPLNPAPGASLPVWHLPQPPHARRQLPSINAWRSRALALPRSCDYINTLICAYYVSWPRSERCRLFCLSSFTCSFCDGSCQCGAVMKLCHFWMVQWKFPTLGVCVCVREGGGTQGLRVASITPWLRQGLFTIFLSVIRRKSIISEIRECFFFFFNHYY